MVIVYEIIIIKTIQIIIIIIIIIISDKMPLVEHIVTLR